MHTRIGNASMSVLKANFGELPVPIVATMPVLATGYLKGMLSASSCPLQVMLCLHVSMEH